MLNVSGHTSFLLNYPGDPQKITLEDLSESKSALEEKSADRSHSVNSMQTATHETTNVAVYEASFPARAITLLALESMLVTE